MYPAPPHAHTQNTHTRTHTHTRTNTHTNTHKHMHVQGVAQQAFDSTLSYLSDRSLSPSLLLLPPLSPSSTPYLYSLPSTFFK